MTLALIDFGSVFARFHAVSGADEPADEAAKRTIAKIRGFGETYMHMAICCDSPPYFRTQISQLYKANREQRGPDYGAQLDRALRVLEADGFPIWRAETMEADDVIASATKAARGRDIEVHLYTSDKDLCQLVDTDVTMLSVVDGSQMTPSGVVAKFGVGPDQLGDWLALVGDAADNVRGVPGVGAKTAAKLLEAFGTISGILEAAANPDVTMTPKLRESLLASVETLGVSRRLVELRFDVPIALDDALVERAQKSLTADRCLTNRDTKHAERFEDPVQDDTTPQDESARPSAIAMANPTTQEFERSIVPSSPVARPIEWQHSLEPLSLNDTKRLAVNLHDSRMYPHFGSPEAIFAAIVFARSFGIESSKVLLPGVLHFIQGRVTMSAQLMVALVLRSGLAEYFTLVESTDQIATYTTHRKGDPKAITFSYLIEEARAAGMKWAAPNATGNIRARTMLRWRCASELARAAFSDVVLGLYAPEEFEG